MTVILGLAIFFIIWWLVLFTVLPFGVTTQQEANEVVPGTPESAPANPRMRRAFLITTGISCLVFAFVYWVSESAIAKSWIDRFFEFIAGTKIFAAM